MFIALLIAWVLTLFGFTAGQGLLDWASHNLILTIIIGLITA
jgi:hypothetical protein